MFSYYVYYRIAPEKSMAANAVLRALIDRIAQDTGVRGRVLVKCGEPNLWMEVYEGIANPATFETKLAAAVSELGLHAVLASGEQRRIECFRAQQACA